MTHLTLEDEADLAAAEVAPNTDDYDPIELREAILRIIDRHIADHDFDLNPVAIVWARSKVQWAVDRADNFADQGGENAEQWRKFARLMHMWLLGSGEGCVVTPLDTRLPELKPLFTKKGDPL